MAKVKPTGFGARLRELREAAGLSAYKLAKASGLTLQGVTRIEKGRGGPNWRSVLALADALGVPTEAFRQPAAATTEGRA